VHVKSSAVGVGVEGPTDSTHTQAYPNPQVLVVDDDIVGFVGESDRRFIGATTFKRWTEWVDAMKEVERERW
jgi:hypothetical protein